jgi:hypothetical protein
VTKTIGDNYRSYSLIIILNVGIVACVRCGLFKISNVSHQTMLLPIKVYATVNYDFFWHLSIQCLTCPIQNHILWCNTLIYWLKLYICKRMIPQYIYINIENHQYKNYNIFIFCVYLTLNFTFHSQYQH